MRNPAMTELKRWLCNKGHLLHCEVPQISSRYPRRMAHSHRKLQLWESNAPVASENSCADATDTHINKDILKEKKN